MKNNKSTIIWIVIVVLIIAGLFFYPRLVSKNNSNTASDVPCLVANLPLSQHIHPTLKIFVDGQEETVPPDIGMGACEKVIHTHETDGVIHVESQDRRRYTLGQFFEVWSKSINREGYNTEVTVDGEKTANPAEVLLKDGQQIIIKYTKI